MKTNSVKNQIPERNKTGKRKNTAVVSGRTKKKQTKEEILYNSWYLPGRFPWIIMLVLAAFVFLFNMGASYGNKLTIGSLSIDQAAQTIQIKVAWENSWRMNTSTLPYNWDAAWIFVKFRDCSSDPQTTQFTHGIVSRTASDNDLDVLNDGQMFDTTKADGSVGIDASPNNTGVMLRPNSEGTYTQISDTILLKITNLPTTGTYDIRVFGIEMVFIQGGNPGGSVPTTFDVGDGNGTQSSDYSLYGSSATAITISSENAISISRGNNVNTCCFNTMNVQAGFPKGWNPFYIMKYEITQGQYADFLNTVSEDMATNLLWTGSYNQNRNRINNTGTAPQKYTTDRTDRACNFLSWSRASSYLDWAALRPLTELQFEKAARGFATKTLYENATGGTSATRAATISGAENGTETITTANANVCAAAGGNFTGGDGGTGPLRVGIFATASTSTRLATGGSYFGVMELSGNVQELYLTVCAGISGAVSENGVSLGNGTLAATGYHDATDWPAGNIATSSSLVIRRGGHWASSLGPNSNLAVSNNNLGNPGCDCGQNAYMGGRGGR